MPQKELVVGLDIGSTKIVAVAAELTGEGLINVLGVGEAPSLGMRKGTIVDIEATVKAIEEAVKKAESMAGITIESAYVSITGAHISSLNNRGVVAVTSEDKEIGSEDINRVLQAAKVISIPSNRSILHVIPREFTVDGQGEIIDPSGMSGSRLEVETHIVSGATTSIQNLLKSVQKAGLKVDELVLAPMASAGAALQSAEKELGVVLIDIGGGTTDITIFANGSLWYTAVVPVGGEYIIKDLAVGLCTPVPQAESILKEYGCVLTALTPENESVDVPSVGSKEIRKVSKKMVASIIEPRVQEILSLAKKTMEASNSGEIIPGGVVLTGGIALIPGIQQLAAEELQMTVRIGSPVQVAGLADMVNSPAYATVVGLLRYGSRYISYRQPQNQDNELMSSWVEKIKTWFKDFF